MTENASTSSSRVRPAVVLMELERQLQARQLPRNDVLCVRPVDREVITEISEMLATYKQNHSGELIALDSKIMDFSLDIAESKENFDAKTEIVCELMQIVRKVIGHHAMLWMVGSTAQMLCMQGGDLDLCLYLEYEEEALTALSRVNAYLQKHKPEAIATVEFISSARIPIIKLHFNEYYKNLVVDINCNRTTGILSSHLVLHYVMFDPRVRPLIFALKNWALKAGIVDSYAGKLNSFSIAMMVIHYLQCVCSPAILPNLSELFPNLFDREFLTGNHDLCIPEEFKSHMEPNNQTVGELFLGIFIYYSRYESQYAISVGRGERHPMSFMGGRFIIREPVGMYDIHNNLECQTVTDVFARAVDGVFKNFTINPVDLVGDAL